MSARRERSAARVDAAVKAHAPALLAFFARRIDPSYEAADLLAETLLILWKRASSLPERDEEVRPWMFGIARNVLLHHRRAVVRERAAAERLRGILATSPAPGLNPASDYDELHRALAALDEVDRDIIGLVHWEGFSLLESSRILRMNENTVRSRYHRARKRLREQLTPAVTDGESRDAQSRDTDCGIRGSSRVR